MWVLSEGDRVHNWTQDSDSVIQDDVCDQI